MSLTLLVNRRGNLVLMYLTSRFRVLVQIIVHGCPVPCPGGVFLTVCPLSQKLPGCVCAFCTLDTTFAFTLLGVFSGPTRGALFPILIRKRAHFGGLYVEMLYFGMTLRISLSLTLTANSYIFSAPHCNCCWWHSFRVVLWNFLSLWPNTHRGLCIKLFKMSGWATGQQRCLAERNDTDDTER